MGLSGKASKRESEFYLGSGRRLCFLQYVINYTSGHRVGSRVFWDKTPTAPSWRLTGAIFLWPVLLLSRSSQRVVRVSRGVLCVVRCLPEQVPGRYCTLPTHVGTRNIPVCRFPSQQAHESLKKHHPSLARDWVKRESTRVGSWFQTQKSWGSAGTQRKFPPISWVFSSWYLINI